MPYRHAVGEPSRNRRTVRCPDIGAEDAGCAWTWAR